MEVHDPVAETVLVQQFEVITDARRQGRLTAPRPAPG
jgi:hypothetical protein